MADARMLGKEKVLARMAKFPAELKAAVQAQLETEAHELAEAIKRAVPVDTGTLRDTIEAKAGSRPLSMVVVAGGPATMVKIRKGVSDQSFAKSKASGSNRGAYDYMRAVEFGHLTIDGVHVPAQPFFYPTYRARKKALKRRIAQAATKQLKTLFPE